MKKRTTTLAIVLLVMGSVIVSYCLTNDLGGIHDRQNNSKHICNPDTKFSY